ncbi:DUF535 family protein [Chelatococcus sp. SYSU_G07232]|uniref:DUF535 family protein n=1 Tax=Chelatococcus albus TaxID=3047466 RepID=A0ABT7ACV5_9HYPH|nr:DUF535 family protein [Chelatococcus sp. SYSU_G07232]MDJ1157205.1 DUF535 family protein [Chelatococcus sp. SYSU_G07232]
MPSVPQSSAAAAAPRECSAAPSRRSRSLLLAERRLERSPGFLAAAGLVWAHARAVFASQGWRHARFFLLRSLFAPRTVAAWLRFLDTFARAEGLGPPPSDLPPKPLRNYARHGLRPAARVALLCAHHRIAAEVLPGLVMASLWRGQDVELGALAGKRGCYRLVLTRALFTRQEGELTISLQDAVDDLLLAKITFVMAPLPNGQACLVIGGLQGAPPGAHKHRIVQATRDLSGLRPKAAVLLAVQAFAAAAELTEIHAVSNARHIIAGKSRGYRAAKMHADYDAFWLERGGTACPFFGFRLPVLDPVLLSAGRTDATPSLSAKDRQRHSIVAAVARALSAPALAGPRG